MSHTQSSAPLGPQPWAYSVFLSHCLMFFFLGFGFQAHAAPPEVSIGTLPEAPRVGQPFELTLDINWEGASRDVQILGVDLGPASTFEEGVSKQSQRRRGAMVSHRLQLSLTPSLPGEVSLGPIFLLYQEGADKSTLRLPLPGAYPLKVSPASGSQGGFLLFLLVLPGAGIYFWRRNKGEKRSKKSDVHTDSGTLDTLLEDAQRAAKRGEWEICLGKLVDLRQKLPDTSETVPSLETLEEMHQRLRYGGGSPDGHKINRWLRNAERVLVNIKQTT